MALNIIHIIKVKYALKIDYKLRKHNNGIAQNGLNIKHSKQWGGNWFMHAAVHAGKQSSIQHRRNHEVKLVMWHLD